MKSENDIVPSGAVVMQMAGRPTTGPGRGRVGRRQLMARAIVVLVVVCAGGVVRAESESEPTREYKVKAAFTYHFISFVSGGHFERKAEPAETGDDTPILIGIIGRDPFKGAFTPLADRRVHGRQIQVKLFRGLSQFDDEDEPIKRHPEMEEIKQCDLLFIAASEHQYLGTLLEPIRQEGILTLADMPGFLEWGGIINFVMEKDKVKFEINTAGARRAELRLRSQLLRLATRVIDEDAVE